MELSNDSDGFSSSLGASSLPIAQLDYPRSPPAQGQPAYTLDIEAILGDDSDSDSESYRSYEPTIPSPAANQRFVSVSAAIHSINTFGREEGFAVVIRSSKRDGNGVKKTVYLRCDRGCPKRDPDIPRQRRTTSSLTECPYRLTLRLQRDDHPHPWLLTIENPVHNHFASRVSTHTAHRRAVIQSKYEEISTQLRQRVKSQQILTGLHQAGFPFVKAKDIYNVQSRLRNDLLGGRTSIRCYETIALLSDSLAIFNVRPRDLVV